MADEPQPVVQLPAVVNLPHYPPFDCKSDGKLVRWTKWRSRLVNNVFVGYNITNDRQKKALLLSFGGVDLNDIVESFPEADLVPGQDETHFGKIVTAITNHFNPEVNLEFQRMESKCQSSDVCAPVGVNTGCSMAKDSTACQVSIKCKDDSYNGTSCCDHPGLRSSTGACNSNVSNSNIAGYVNGDIITNHAKQCIININSIDVKGDRKRCTCGNTFCSKGSIEINLTSHSVDKQLGCQGEANPQVVPSQLTEDKSNSDSKIVVTGAPFDESKTYMTIPEGSKSGVQDDSSLSTYRPTISVRSSCTSNHGTSEHYTDEDSYHLEEVDDFILVSHSDINLQGKVKVSSHDCTDGKDLHPTKAERASKHQDGSFIGGKLMTDLFQDPPQNHEKQISITSLQEGIHTPDDSVSKEHTQGLRHACGQPGNDINSPYACTEPYDNFLLEDLLEKVKTMQEPWRSHAEEAFLSLLDLADNGDIAQLIHISLFLCRNLIEAQIVFHPSANYQSSLNYVKLLQRIRNLSDNVRWRTELNVSYIVKIAQQDPSKLRDIVTFLDNILLNDPN